MSHRANRRPTVIGLFTWTRPPGTDPRPVNPDVPLPYRADRLPQVAPLDLEVVPPAVGRLHVKARDVLEHRSGVRLDLLVRAASRAGRADAVLAFLEDQIPALSWIRRRGLPPYSRLAAIGLSCWWAEELVTGKRSGAEVARHVEGLDRLLVLSANQRDIFARAGVEPEKVRPVLFGADHEYFTPTSIPERFDVLSVGVDRGRDWRTLVDAARLLPDAQVHIVTGPGRVPQDRPDSVVVHPPVDFSTYREMLRAARVVVVPSHELAYPTGQSVLLEAMACGRCVVVTSSEAMSDYIADGRSNLAVPPADPAALAETLRAALGDDARRERIGREARRTVEERFTFDRMWTQIGAEIADALGPVLSAPDRDGSP